MIGLGRLFTAPGWPSLLMTAFSDLCRICRKRYFSRGLGHWWGVREIWVLNTKRWWVRTGGKSCFWLLRNHRDCLTGGFKQLLMHQDLMLQSLWERQSFCFCAECSDYNCRALVGQQRWRFWLCPLRLEGSRIHLYRLATAGAALRRQSPHKTCGQRPKWWVQKVRQWMGMELPKNIWSLDEGQG